MGQQVDNLQRQIDDCNRVIEQCRNNMKNNSAAGREQWKHTLEQKQEQKKNLQAQMSIARANDKLAADKEKERLAQEKAKQKEREAEPKKRNKEGGQEKAQQSKPSSSSSSTYATSTPSSSTYSRPASSGPSLTEVIASEWLSVSNINRRDKSVHGPYWHKWRKIKDGLKQLLTKLIRNFWTLLKS